MKWNVVFAPSAALSTTKLPPDVKRSVKAAILAIAVSPSIGKALVRELSGLCSYPMRRYRIVYALDPVTRRILIVAVGHRTTIYEELAKAPTKHKSR